MATLTVVYNITDQEAFNQTSEDIFSSLSGAAQRIDGATVTAVSRGNEIKRMELIETLVTDHCQHDLDPYDVLDAIRLCMQWVEIDEVMGIDDLISRWEDS